MITLGPRIPRGELHPSVATSTFSLPVSPGTFRRPSRIRARVVSEVAASSHAANVAAATRARRFEQHRVEVAAAARRRRRSAAAAVATDEAPAAANEAADAIDRALEQCAAAVQGEPAAVRSRWRALVVGSGAMSASAFLTAAVDVLGAGRMDELKTLQRALLGDEDDVRASDSAPAAARPPSVDVPGLNRRRLGYQKTWRVAGTGLFVGPPSLREDAVGNTHRIAASREPAQPRTRGPPLALRARTKPRADPIVYAVPKGVRLYL